MSRTTGQLGFLALFNVSTSIPPEQLQYVTFITFFGKRREDTLLWGSALAFVRKSTFWLKSWRALNGHSCTPLASKSHRKRPYRLKRTSLSESPPARIIRINNSKQFGLTYSNGWATTENATCMTRRPPPLKHLPSGCLLRLPPFQLHTHCRGATPLLRRCTCLRIRVPSR